MNVSHVFQVNLQAEDLVQHGDCILLAVSGGLDSVALLHLFHESKLILDLSLTIVHVHHGIRAQEADLDLEFVRELSKRYQLPFYFRKVNAKVFAQHHKLSLEESARILRYQIFDKVCKETACRKVATGHTADDQAETVVHHFLRGSGIAGLRGMTEARGTYIRPLLIFSRTQLEKYISQQHLTHREDSSNQDARFTRNRIRHQLIPHLKESYNPNLIQTLGRTAHIFEETEAFLNTHAKEAFNSLVSLHKKNEIILEIHGFLRYFKIVRKYILFHACELLGIDVAHFTFDKLERILKLIEDGTVGKRIHLADNFELLVDHDGIVLKKRGKNFHKAKLSLLERSVCRFNNFELSWSIFEKPKNLNFDNNKSVEFVSLDRIGGELFLRTFLPGDRFIPLNFSGHKKVADYFTDRKVPHHLREVTPILESQEGIVWICGYTIDDRFKVTDATNKILKLEIKELSDEA
ncbi:tRNA lysidine(34) synthetase TilS [candidate division KSB1 bacterium]|nr:tRNA lysidine(34) synthetase TilS [candidate division KSB1 bacterium]